MKALIISYTLRESDKSEKIKAHKKLYGYTDNSNKGKYVYNRTGVLETIPHLKLNRGVIIIREEDKSVILDTLKKNNAIITKIPINLDKSLIKISRSKLRSIFKPSTSHPAYRSKLRSIKLS